MKCVVRAGWLIALIASAAGCGPSKKSDDPAPASAQPPTALNVPRGEWQEQASGKSDTPAATVSPTNVWRGAILTRLDFRWSEPAPAAEGIDYRAESWNRAAADRVSRGQVSMQLSSRKIKVLMTGESGETVFILDGLLSRDGGWASGLAYPAEVQPGKGGIPWWAWSEPAEVQQPDNQLNLNTATPGALESAGLSPATSRALVERRLRTGPYSKISDCSEVAGSEYEQVRRVARVY